jgi:hypothetical protein
MALKIAKGQEKAHEEFPISSDVALPSKATRHRSPSYPTVGLQEALERTKKFYGIDGKAGAPTETAVKHIGFASAHGQALSVLSALKKFGLLEDKGGRVVPTQRAVELVNLPEQDPRRLEALRQAALAPAIYRQLIQEYRETGLPSNETLKAELVAYKNFNPNSVDDFIKFFKSTLEFAGLSDLSVIELEPEMPPEQTETESQPRGKTGGLPPPPMVRIEDAMRARTSFHPQQRSVANTFVWPLSKDINAQVTFTGADVKAAHMDRLIKYLELAKLALEEEQSE